MGQGEGLRPLVGLLAALAVALTGTRVSAIAIPWFVLVTTGSAALTGLVVFCEMAPYVVAKTLSGPVLDRTGARRVSWTTDIGSAVAVAAVPLLHFAGALPFWGLLVLVALAGAARGPGDLAKQVMVPEAADRSGVVLERATGLAGMVERLASTVGPFAGGLLIAVTSPLAGLLVNAVCFALGAVIIAVVLPRGMGRSPDLGPGGPAGPADGHDTAAADAGAARGAPPGTSPGADDPRADDPRVPEPAEVLRNGTAPPATVAGKDGYWRRLAGGFRFLRTQPLLLLLYVTAAVTNLLDAAFTSVMLPVWVESSGHGPATIGLLAAAMGGTAVLGSTVAAVWAHRLPRRGVYFAGYLVAGAPRFLAMALGAPLWVVVLTFAVGGLGAGFLNPVISAVCFERIPRPLLGRVTSVGTSLAWAGMPLGGLFGGLAVTAVGLVPVLVCSGLLYALVTTVAGLRPEWRAMDRARAAARRRDRAPSTDGPPEDARRDPADGPVAGPGASAMRR
ncbi:MFS transporter [Streptomyces bohaiensis]|uniref:MFS transporter n=1 Tax=Streptomyces bohaiensis TaxID=1431344 RepID=UPI0028AD376D|nr:MFS transporter [Streptomyces bohaiensis]